jgi:hypothetical protein
VRLIALKLLLQHPDATPLQLAQALCSPDNRHGEFVEVFDLHKAMRAAWNRLAGVTDSAVYEYLTELYLTDPASNVDSVLGVLMHLGTPQALAVVQKIEPTLPERARGWFPFVLTTITIRAEAR